MTADILEFPDRLSTDLLEQLEEFAESLPLGFRSEHCEPARSMLGWSIEALAFRSKVSPEAVTRLEHGKELNRVTMQALAFALEKEGLIFFPGHPPMRGANCAGGTSDPRRRDDYHLLE